MRGDIQWSRIFAEGTAIVLSILLAFAIDAWWEDRKEAGTQQVQLQSLLGEFKEARHHLISQLERLESSLAGTLKILELMGPDAAAHANSDFSAAIVESLNIGVSTPQQGTLLYLLASRDRIISDNSDLWSKLQTWPTLMGDLEVDSQHLDSNREVNFIDALIRLGVPMLNIIRNDAEESPSDTRLQLPPSNFNVDLSVLMLDPGIETIFTMRAIRFQVLIALHKRAIETAHEVIGYLEHGKGVKKQERSH